MDGTIVVIAEHFLGEIRSITWELAAFAVDIQKLHPGAVKILVLGDRVSGLAHEIAGRTGLDVIGLQEPGLRSYNGEVYRELLSGHLPGLHPSFVCMGHSSVGWDCAPGLAVRLGAACMTGVEQVLRKDDLMCFTRSVHNGKIVADVAPRVGTTILTLQPGRVKPIEKVDRVKPGSVVIRSVSCSPRRSRCIEVKRVQEVSDALSQAEVIVSAGRGIASKENVQLISRLAALFHRSAVAGSRPVCDLRWLEYKQQVGVTGATVTPRLYFACGISGAFQHVAGMQSSDFIVALNTDPNAPIFNVADICITEDLVTFIPAFIETCKKGGGGAQE